jgi:hypothetical protein
MTRRLLIAGVIAALLGFGVGVLRPRENPYQGLYLSARCETAFELDTAVDQAEETYHWTMRQRPDLHTDITDVPAYLRERRDLAVREYNAAAERLARKGSYAGRIDDRDQAWDCDRLLKRIPPAPADALGAQP